MAKAKKETFADFLRELKQNAVVAPKSVEVIPERKYFLIVSEGERTEPNYFNHFKTFLPKHLIETISVHGEGDNTVNIVRKTIALRDERKKNVLLPDYNEVWAVYDKDDFPANRFNTAVRLATQNDIESGHSNQSFELWYVLHFQFLQNALHRGDYITTLSRILNFKYEKNDLNVIKFLFQNGNVRQAIEWAKELEANNLGVTPANSCPYTRVYLLVERLLEYVKHDA
jgi:hypothetical protein